MRRRFLAIAALAALSLAFRLAEDPEPDMAPGQEAELRQAAQLRGLALADMEDGNYGRAIDHLESLTELLPDNILPPVNLAICHFRLNQPEQALTEIRRAQQIDPDNAQMLYALARVLMDEPNQQQKWTEVVEHFAQTHPRDPRPYFLRGEQAALEKDWPAALAAYGEATRRDPENLALMTEQLVAAAEAQDPTATSDSLDAMEDRLNGFEDNLAVYSDRLRDLIDEADPAALRPPALVLRNLLRPTDLYQLGLIPLIGGIQSGGSMFPQLDFEPPLPKSIQGGQDIALAFVEAPREWSSALASGPQLTLLAPDLETVGLLQLGAEGWTRLSQVSESPRRQNRELDFHGVEVARYQDFDQDGVSDLIGIDRPGTLWFFQGAHEGGFAAGQRIFDAARCEGTWDLHPLDLDHDGDLDLWSSCAIGSDLYLQNNGDGSWTDRTHESGLGPESPGSTDLVTADFDDDGDLDLLTTHLDSNPRLYLNRRAGPLIESGSDWGLGEMVAPMSGARTADFNNDGLFDLILWGGSGGRVLLNDGGGFRSTALPEISQRGWQEVGIGDFDNDGDQDAVIAVEEPRGLILLRNRRTSFVAEEISFRPDAQVAGFIVGDFDGDGDLDLAVRQGTRTGTLAFLSNQGGNRNQWLGLRLRGRHDNNSKNNTQGLFTRLEIRIGDAYQALIGNGGINHLGLGAARQADVIRVVWTNGVAQTWSRVSANRTLVEEQILKGSCPFLYTWNGGEFEFVTDLMWRSTLGMTFADGRPAPHQSARDYVLIRGEQLAPTGDEIWLQITEELWETVFTDQLELMAVDHPKSMEMVVDEAFRLPPHPQRPPVHWIDRSVQPTAASDHTGANVLPAIVERDGRYVDQLPLSRFQGVTRGHHLELEFRDVPADERARLLLWGWIFPTDTSINFALQQDPTLRSDPPKLEIEDSAGRWQVLEPFMGFPNGKNKAVVVDLGKGRVAGTVHLRISTSMQIYWDAAALAIGEAEPPARWTHLQPQTADLHYRGYSKLVRASETSPHLFDYSRVESGPRFRDLAGRYTRFGPVQALLTEADDRYVVMNAGDEMTVRFDARALPTLPVGWRRDWILFTDGWVKDGDIHTVASQTVEPLPYHGMSSYPDSPAHRYPLTEENLQYLEEYQTRIITDEPFRSRVQELPARLDGSGPSG